MFHIGCPNQSSGPNFFSHITFIVIVLMLAARTCLQNVQSLMTKVRHFDILTLVIIGIFSLFVFTE